MAKKNISGSQYIKKFWSHNTFIIKMGLLWLGFIGFIALLPLEVLASEPRDLIVRPGTKDPRALHIRGRENP